MMQSKASQYAAIAVVLVVLLLMSMFVTFPSQCAPVVVEPSFVKHFAGEYGTRAFENLTAWSDALFGRTMRMYRDYTQQQCNQGACAQLVANASHAEPPGLAKYNLFDAFVECPGGQRLRMGPPSDGGKWLCTSLFTAPCTIFSIGSNGNYLFEEAMLSSTPCTVFTFDCSYEGKNLSDRHMYLKKCLGTEAKMKANSDFLSLNAAATQLGVNSISMLKIDAEGYEYDVLSGWNAHDTLPEQVAVEIHHTLAIYSGTAAFRNEHDFSNLMWPMHDVKMGEIALLFSHLAKLGYAVASRDDNSYGLCCSEFLLLRVGEWRS